MNDNPSTPEEEIRSYYLLRKRFDQERQTLGRRLMKTSREKWGYIGVSLLAVGVVAFTSFSIAPTTELSLPFNLWVTLFVAVGGALMLPFVLLLQMGAEKKGGVEAFIGRLRRDVQILEETRGTKADLQKEIALDEAREIAARVGDELRDYEADEIRNLVSRRELTWVRGVTPHTDWHMDSEKGEILHGEGMRHVLFRIGTIQEILLEVDSAVSSEQLKELGSRMGKGFGEEFIGHLERADLRGTDLDELIEQWCDFDISGGWGKWHPSRLSPEDVGTIQVKNNFLTAQAQPPVLQNKSLCPLLEGYISGVLEFLARSARPGHSWRAEVEEIRPCGVHSEGLKPCEFTFSLHRSGSSEGVDE